MADRAGQLVAGQYRLAEEIGRGEFGAACVREARTPAHLGHRRTVTVHKVVEHGGWPWIRAAHEGRRLFEGANAGHKASAVPGR